MSSIHYLCLLLKKVFKRLPSPPPLKLTNPQAGRDHRVQSCHVIKENLCLRGSYEKWTPTRQPPRRLSQPIYHHLPPPLNTVQLSVTNWQMGSRKTRWPCVTRASRANKGMFGQERLSAGGEANLTGIWAGSTAVYRWKTVCESKSSLKTFEDVWQVPVPKAAMC